jgi:tripartite-type tricarboxylate transporter receptor subunit TctC
MKRLIAAWFITMAVFLQATASSAGVQDRYPSHPVRIIVPMPAGSAPDIRVRLVAEQLSKLLGQQVVIENRPGGGGVIGVSALLSASHDGYTLLAAPASVFTILPARNSGLPFNVDRDLVPIGTVMSEGQIIAVSAKLGIDSLADLITAAKKQPDTIVVGTNPAGSLPHLAAKLIVARTGAPMTVVPYSSGGSNAAIREVMAARIQVVIEGRPGLKGAIDVGTLKPLAIMTSERLPELPTLPAAAETIPGIRAVGWVALCAPRGTPAEVVNVIGNDLRKALDAQDLRKRVEQIGTPFRPLFGPELARFIKSEQDLWRPVVSEH